MSGLLLLRRRLSAKSLLSRSLQARPYGILEPARTRFAPSPTGYLHLGSIRTALYNYLLARATGGQFIIRLEDTDQTRFVEDAEERLYDDLKWAGMDWDEGPDKSGKFGPYKQSQRLGLYREHAELLLNSGHAFRCFCPSKPNAKPTAESEAGWGNGYPGTCKWITKPESDRRAANGEPHVIRFISKEEIEYMDIVYGLRRLKSAGNDPIIMKTDGFPTYHFANVVDDHHMKITHVIRGAEWLISTPLHIEMYRALDWEPPSFGHVGLLVDQQRQKLSKRDKDNIGVSVFRSNNILPQALMNFAILLGWNPQLQKNPQLSSNGVMTMKEMQDNFTLKFTRGDIVVEMTKLKFFQNTWTRNLISGKTEDAVTLANHFVDPITLLVERIDKIIYEKDEFEAKRQKKQTQPELPAAHALFLNDLGIDIYQHHSLTRNDPTRSVKDHVLAILRAAKGEVQSPEQFVRDYKYAFFPPTAKALQDSICVVRSDMARMNQINYLRIGKTGGVEKDILFRRVMNVFHHQLLDVRNHVLQEDVPKSREKNQSRSTAANLAVDATRGVEHWWSEKRLNQKLNTLTNAIHVTLPDGRKDPNAPWKYLRWAFLCAQPQTSHMIISKLLLAWGPDRSFKMIRRAYKGVMLGEKLLKRERLHEQKLRREVLRRVMTTEERREKRGERRLDLSMASDAEEGVSSDSLLPHDEQVASNEDPFTAMLRSAHREGAFVSRSQPRPSAVAAARGDDSEEIYKQRTSAADVDRPSQMLHPSEWKNGTRHLPVAAVEKAADFNSQVPIGLIPWALAQSKKDEPAPWYAPKPGDDCDRSKEKMSEFGPLAPDGAGRRNHILRQGYAQAIRLQNKPADVTPLALVVPPASHNQDQDSPQITIDVKPSDLQDVANRPAEGARDLGEIEPIRQFLESEKLLAPYLERQDVAGIKREASRLRAEWEEKQEKQEKQELTPTGNEGHRHDGGREEQCEETLSKKKGKKAVEVKKDWRARVAKKRQQQARNRVGPQSGRFQ